VSGESIVTAFKQAEQHCYQFLRGVLNATHDADAFCPELPESFAVDSARGVWCFIMASEAGDPPMDYDFNFDTPGGGGTDPLQKFPAMFSGFWKDRTVALRACGLIRAAMPIVPDSIGNLYRFRIRRDFSCKRATMPVRADQETGGTVRGWGVEYPMEVTFHMGA